MGSALAAHGAEEQKCAEVLGTPAHGADLLDGGGTVCEDGPRANQ